MPATITLTATSSSRTYPVSFYGEAAEDNALDFIARRTDLTVTELAPVADEVTLGNEFTRLIAVLYPTCVHGMSADLCEGPNHYGGYWEEREADFYESGIF